MIECTYITYNSAWHKAKRQWLLPVTVFPNTKSLESVPKINKAHLGALGNLKGCSTVLTSRWCWEGKINSFVLDLKPVVRGFRGAHNTYLLVFASQDIHNTHPASRVWGLWVWWHFLMSKWVLRVAKGKVLSFCCSYTVTIGHPLQNRHCWRPTASELDFCLLFSSRKSVCVSGPSSWG